MEALMEELTRALIAVGSADQDAKLAEDALIALKGYQESNMPEYVAGMSTVLATEEKPIIARKLAGLMLKDALVEIQKHDDDWKTLSAKTRSVVKNNLLQALRSNENVARHTAAQAASEVAAVELPSPNDWPELIPYLLENVKSQPDGCKVASLETLGFTCERISTLDGLPPIDDATMNDMLNIIVVNGIGEVPENEISLAAITAMRNSLVFAVRNMNVEEERDYIVGSTCKAMQSPSPQVRKVAFECLTEIAVGYWSSLCETLMSKLTTETPRVSYQACHALYKLASAFADDDAAATPGTNALSQYIPTMFETLLNTANRRDGDEHNLRFYALHTLSACIKHSAPDVQPFLLQQLPVVLQRLSESFLIPAATEDDQEKKEALQGYYCRVLQGFMQKISKEEVAPHADAAMTNLLQVLQNENAISHAEAFYAISAFVDNQKADFERHMEDLQPFLIKGLNNFEASHVCMAAVSLIGDLCQALQGHIEPHCREIMSALAKALGDTNLHRIVKPSILGTFGEVALVIQADFEPYMESALQFISQATKILQAPPEDEDAIEFVNNLRESILDAYTGIILGLKACHHLDLFLPDGVHRVLQSLEQIAAGEEPDHYVVSKEVISKAVGLIGDVASAMDPQQLDQPYIHQLLQEGMDSGDEGTIETAQRAGNLICQVPSGN